MPRPTEPTPSPDRALSRVAEPGRGRTEISPRQTGWAGWAACALILLAGAGGDGCPMDMDPPGNDDTGVICDLGAPIGAPTVSFANDLMPLFENSGCLSAGCHGGGLPSSGYRLGAYASAFDPGDQATDFGICPIVPGDPDASYMIEKLSPGPRTGARMPFLQAPLTAGEIELIRTWIAEGAANN